jgi:3-(3-hydroxy-phenyl)propionate hydroxylase
MICDVAVVGLGPVGVTLANLLALQGLSVACFEREPSVYHHPRAGSCDGEVMRVFQTLGAADEIAAETFVSPGMRFVNAQGRLLLDWPRPMVEGPQAWHSTYRFHQPSLETALRKRLAGFPNATVHLQREAVAVEPHADHVLVRHAGGSLTARYVVGCDGARSLVRGAMGVPLEDLGSHERWLILDIVMKKDRPDLPVATIQVCDAARPVTVIKMVGMRRRWEIMLMPGDEPESMVEPARVWALLAKWIGPHEAEIERAVVYTFHSVIARGWRAGRLLLAGDSCHQTPPFLGQGLCSGVRDASNLAWKLAWVLQGRARESLLDTYEAERSPHVRAYIETAIRLGGIIQTTDPAVAAKRDAEMLANPPTMQSIQPPLGPGLHGEAPSPAGTLSAQPRLADGRRLDDAVGYRFALLATRALAAPVKNAHVLVAEDEPAVSRYLGELGAEAVLVRPDRYILGAASTRGALEEIIERIPAA